MNRLVASAISLFPAIVFAGGSYEPVTVQSLTRTSQTDYELVVIPPVRSPNSYPDPYMSGCSTFTVRGTWSKKHLPDFVSREAHIGALARLERALKSKERVNFGWMGPGFEPSATNRCVVSSRGLEYIIDNNTAMVLSYYGAV